MPLLISLGWSNPLYVIPMQEYDMCSIDPRKLFEDTRLDFPTKMK